MFMPFAHAIPPMPFSEVVFSFFRYPARHAPSAFILMGFQGLAADRRMPRGMIRLMGCGSRDGFSIVPDFNRYCLMSALDDPAEQSRLRQTRLYRLVARPSIEQLHFTLAPARGHGTWDGETLFDYSGERLGERPFVVLTHARVSAAHARDFWRSVPDVRDGLRQAQGCAYQIGFGEHPLLTLATFSVWQDLASMQTFAYRHTPHHHVSKAARGDRWLAESLFVRFAIRRLEGDLDQYPKLRRLAEAGLIPTGARKPALTAVEQA
jgi:spheroidene monooxygenase